MNDKERMIMEAISALGGPVCYDQMLVWIYQHKDVILTRHDLRAQVTGLVVRRKMLHRTGQGIVELNYPQVALADTSVFERRDHG